MKKKKDWAGLLIPAGLFIGMGLGFIFGELVGAMILGLGIGFLAMAVAVKTQK